MLLGRCPTCDATWSFGWDEKEHGFYCILCEGCDGVIWIELSRMGCCYDHETFLKEVAEPDGRVEAANEMARSRREQVEAGGDRQ